MSYFVYIKDILGVEINQLEFSWSYGTVAPSATKEAFLHCLIKLSIIITEDDKVFEGKFSDKNYGKYHYFFAKSEEKTIYYERNFFGPKKLRYSIKIDGNNIKVIVNKSYFKYVKHRIMGLHSLSYILTDLTSGILLKNKLATIHCSAVNNRDRSIVIFAPPNTGKTLTSIQLCRDYNYNFIAEDFALTDGEKIWSVPWTSTFRYYDDINESFIDKMSNKMIKLFPLFDLIKFKKSASIDKYIGLDCIKHVSKITNVFILESGESRIDYNKTEGLRKLLNLNRYEFNYHKAPSLLVLDYFNLGFSPEEMYKTEKEIFCKLIENNEFAVIAEVNPMSYANKILNITDGKND